MIIKTKKYGLDPKVYKSIALKSVLLDLWWVFLVPVALANVFWIDNSIWYPISAIILAVLYVAFWWIQFTGIANLEQYKMLFEKLSYEITSKQIIMKLNPKQGMPIDWASIKSAVVEKDAFVLRISRAQFVYLPFKIFNNNNDVKFVESILKRKGYIK